jgi:hypothetical protein
MRTTVKRQALLLRQARIALGVKRNADVYPAIEPLDEAVKAKLGGGMVSHYRDGVWGVSWIGPGAQDCFRACGPSDLALTPAEFIAKVL